MYTQTLLVALLTAVVEARFGQEQGNGAIAAIGALTDLGSPGQAATLAGNSIQFLLAAANPCGKLTQADSIVSELGTSDAAIAAARGLVAAEQNFNPFVVDIPSICSDPTLPTTAALRGVVPLIDPAVGGEALENANSNTSIITPFNADGLSVAQVMVAQGFSNLTAVALDGTKQAASALGTSASASSNSTSVVSSASSNSSVASVSVAASSSSVIACGAVATTFVTMTGAAASTTASSAAESTDTAAAAASSSTASAGTCTGSGSTLLCSSPAVGAGAVTNAVTGNFDGFVASTNTSLDFGLCVPTMKFEAGLDGRATTAFTFQAIDPLVNKGQEEALNPSIITNRIHDQLTNVCGANQAAKDAAAAAQTMIAALGTRDNSTADAWNTALGFAGTNINPDNAPVTGLVGHT
ncbi:uncharacterized protein LY89DRAFT_629452 [Mollisia scopiformis]|uniref:Circumsporozoite protein n=1 Tax=Mollisia scopiformis TaxID=149040 RepID=A0A132BAM8_MOLSC|nr:uncharacterized protein LY89DRAFT_629452 [Mollisia scopiformis]KUJ08914.1 hypothetical protein LY89DRAFT_629452 [Mollisia scopiformis]